MRWYAYDALTGEWLHKDLPLSDVTETYALSGPCAISGTVTPEIASLKRENGAPLIEPWSTIIVGEESDQLRIGGIVTSIDSTGEDLQIEATGVSGYAQGYPLEESYKLSQSGEAAAGFDPLRIVRDLWARIQATPDSDLGLVVDTTKSNYRVGTLAFKTDKTITKKVSKKQNGSGSTTTKTTSSEKGTAEIAGPSLPTVADPDPTHEVSKDGKTVTDTSYKVTITGATYELNWYDNVDIGQTIDSFAKQTPFDYQEAIEWASADKSSVRLRLAFGYPRLGTKQTNLRFAEGENVTTAITVARSGDDFANAVRYLGAGEGSDQVKGTAAKRDGHLRRVKTVTDSSLTTKGACDTQAAGELNAVSQLVDIQQVVCEEHPNARFGDFGVGDDIYVRVYVGWVLTGLWVRVTAISRDSNKVMTLTTKRSDSFRYVSVTE